MKNKKNKFITFEGIDGCGKSTQSEKITKWFSEYTGLETLKTFEPGDWAGGKLLRELVLSDKNFDGLPELFLFLADRAGHLNNVILPALNSNKNVICERYTDSTIAYQTSHEINVKKIIDSCEFPEPDLTILLDIPPELAIKRVQNRNSNKNNKFENDKFESEGLIFMRKVSEAYNRLADENKNRYLKISVTENLTQQEIFEKIISGIKTKLFKENF